MTVRGLFFRRCKKSQFCGRFVMFHSFLPPFSICDKQVLWESAGAFFPRDISRGKSHISRVRGLVVSIPKQNVLTFFGTMRLFGFVRLFSNFFKCPQRVLLSIFLILCNRTNVKNPTGSLFSEFSAL